MKRLAAVLLCVWSFSVPVQGQEIPKAAVDALAKDLAALQDAVLDAQRTQQANDLAVTKFRLLGTSHVTITTLDAILRAGANPKAEPVLTAKKFQTFPVIDRAGDWYAVALPQRTRGVSTGWVQAGDVVPQLRSPEITTPSVAQEVYRALTEKVVQLKDAYKANPYFKVTGFVVNTVPPSVSVNFEFK